MRVFLAAMIVSVAMILAWPCSAHALDNKVEVSYESGSGENFWDDIEKEAYALSYTRFSNGLKNDDSPYGAREFLQHPSSLNISFVDTKYLYHYSPPAMDTRIDYMDYTVSAMYYSGNNKSTGFGVRYRYRDGEEVSDSPGDIRESAFAFTIQKYLTDRLRLTVDYERMYKKEPTDKELVTWVVEAATLVDRYWLRYWYIHNWDNEAEVAMEAVGAEFGIYPVKSLGLFISGEKEEFHSDYIVRADYWISEQSVFGIAYKWVREFPRYLIGEVATVSYGMYF